VVKRGLYIVYVVVVVLMVVIAGQDDGDDRTWGNSASGRSGWSYGGGHK
jgi:hypothetical protein